MKRRIIIAAIVLSTSLSCGAAVWQDSTRTDPSNPNRREILPWNVKAVYGGQGNSPARVPTRIYVIDSGIDDSGVIAQDLNVLKRFNYRGEEVDLSEGGSYPIKSCFGHADAVASIIAAKEGNYIGVVGVSPGSPLVSINSLGKDAQTAPVCVPTPRTMSQLIDAMAVAKREIALTGRLAVVNISSNFSCADVAAPSARAAMLDVATPNPATGYPGAVVVQSAGNHGWNACKFSFDQPSDSDGILVVGAIDSNGQAARTLNRHGGNEPSFNSCPAEVPSSQGYFPGNNAFINPPNLSGSEPGTNYGTCVDVWAPGSDVPVLWKGESAPVRNSGTSYAAPHVAGIAARLIDSMGLTTPAQVEAEIRRRLQPIFASVTPDRQPLKMASLAPAVAPGASPSIHAQPTVEFMVSVNDSENSAESILHGTDIGAAIYDIESSGVRLDASGASYCSLQRYKNQALIGSIPSLTIPVPSIAESSSRYATFSYKVQNPVLRERGEWLWTAVCFGPQGLDGTVKSTSAVALVNVRVAVKQVTWFAAATSTGGYLQEFSGPVNAPGWSPPIGSIPPNLQPHIVTWDEGSPLTIGLGSVGAASCTVITHGWIFNSDTQYTVTEHGPTLPAVTYPAHNPVNPPAGWPYGQAYLYSWTAECRSVDGHTREARLWGTCNCLL